MTSPTIPLSRRRRVSVVLTVGFLALAGAVIAARRAPVDGYELSIYTATPILFWTGLVVAIVAAALVALSAPPGSVMRRLAVVLGPLAVVSLVGLPLFRGYHYYGAGDALSYLGWARLIAHEQLNPTEFLYPGIQSTAIFLSNATGLSLRRSLMTIPTLFVGAFTISVALVVGRITTGSKGVVAGAFAALLLLPVNNIHTYISPYPTSAAIFFTPIVFYLLFNYVTDSGSIVRIRGVPVVTPFGVLLAIAGIATTLYHPQMGANVVAILVVVLGLQVLTRVVSRWVGNSTMATHRSIVAPAIVIVGFFALWAPRFDRARGTFDALVNLLVTGSTPGGAINAKEVSLAVLGGGIGELFLKIFAVSSLLSLVAGVVMLTVVVRRRNDDSPDRTALLTYLTVAFVPPLVLFIAFFVANLSVQQFRYLGFIMVFVTILVAVAFADSIPFGQLGVSSTTRTTFAVVVFVLLLVPQIAIVFQSPYMYQPSSGVSEQTMTGYQTAFDHRDPEVWYTGVRGGPRRYVDALLGTSGTETTPGGQTFEGKDEMIPFSVWGHNMTTFYSRCRYVALEQSDYDRELTLYDGFRYDMGGFRQMDTDQRIQRVQSNGEFRLYVVTPEGSTCTN